MQKLTIMILICTYTLSLKTALSEEQSIETEVSSMANKALAHGFAEKYHEDYLSSIVHFNKRSQKLSKVLVDLGRKKMAQRVQNFELPKFSLKKNHQALLNIGPHHVSVTTNDLFKGQIMLNQAPFDITGELSTEKVRHHLAGHPAVQTSWLDLLINQAHAQDSDPFEIAVFATIMAMQESFDQEWCLRSACEQERSQRNFEQVMRTVEEKAQACQNDPNSSEMSDIAYEIVDYIEYDSARYRFEDTLEEAFNNHPVQSATCQDFVESLHKDELDEVTSKGEVGGYFSGLSSVKASQNKLKNKQAFEQYIQKICNPYTKLRNCLIQQRYSSIRRIYDETRKPGKENGSSENYEVKPRGSSSSGR